MYPGISAEQLILHHHWICSIGCRQIEISFDAHGFLFSCLQTVQLIQVFLDGLSSGTGACTGDVAVHHRRCGPDALWML